MGITVFKDSADSNRMYLRVTRAIKGKEQQRYVRVKGQSKAAMKRAMQEAREIDQRLQQWQNAVRQLQSLSGEALIHDDGSIVGLQLQTRQRAGRRPATEFKIRVKTQDRPAVFKSVSVDRYGFDEAFNLAIQRICELRDLPADSEACQKMLECSDTYRNRLETLNIESSDASPSNTRIKAPKSQPSAALESTTAPQPMREQVPDSLKKRELAIPAMQKDSDNGWINQAFSRLFKR